MGIGEQQFSLAKHMRQGRAPNALATGKRGRGDWRSCAKQADERLMILTSRHRLWYARVRARLSRTGLDSTRAASSGGRLSGAGTTGQAKRDRGGGGAAAIRHQSWMTCAAEALHTLLPMGPGSLQLPDP